MRLKDRIAIVTGGSSGIGRGICLEFAREGARVVVADVQEEPKRGKYFETDVSTTTLEEIGKLGGEGVFVQADVADEEAVRGLIARAVEGFGGVDILVNNAGINIHGTSQEVSAAEWDRVIAVDLRGMFLTTQSAIPYLRRSAYGRIVNISSVMAYAGGGGPAYSAAKAGVLNLTRDITVEVAADDITVNAVAPGYIETAAQDYQTEEQVEAGRARTLLARLGTPRDIGRACVFFASDDAAWITGTALPVDGGWTAHF